MFMNITNMEMAQVTVELYAGLVSLLSVLIISFNGHKKSSLLLFRRMFLVTACIFFAESGAYIFRGNVDALSGFMTRLTNFLVFLLNVILMLRVLDYIYNLLREKNV